MLYEYDHAHCLQFNNRTQPQKKRVSQNYKHHIPKYPYIQYENMTQKINK